MENNHKTRVKGIADRIHIYGCSQIVIDLVQEDVEELLDSPNPTPDEIMSLNYRVSILEDVFNPELKEDINLLRSLISALEEWGDDRSFVNKTLGLDPNK